MKDDPTGATPVVDRLTSGTPADVGGPGMIGRRRVYHVLAALLLLALTLRTAVTGLSPLLPRVSAGVPLSPAEAGIVGALPPFSFAAAGLAGPALLRRVAGERLVILAMILEGLGLLIRPVVRRPGSLHRVQHRRPSGHGSGQRGAAGAGQGLVPAPDPRRHLHVRHGHHGRDVVPGSARGAGGGRRGPGDGLDAPRLADRAGGVGGALRRRRTRLVVGRPVTREPFPSAPRRSAAPPGDSRCGTAGRRGASR